MTVAAIDSQVNLHILRLCCKLMHVLQHCGIWFDQPWQTKRGEINSMHDIFKMSFSLLWTDCLQCRSLSLSLSLFVLCSFTTITSS